MSADSETPPVSPAAVAPAQAIYFDGTSNRRRMVTLRAGPALEIVEDGKLVASWPYDHIRRAEGSGGILRLRLEPLSSLARLEIRDAACAQEVAARCAALDAHDDRRYTKRIVLWSFAAACSIVLVIVFAIPLIADRLAPLIPAPVERRLGDAVDRQIRFLFGDKTCKNADGVAAFAKLVEKLRVAGNIEAPLDAQVIDSPIANAIALPGGKIYLLKGMLNDARDADEIAGVLAHELGHIWHRDGLRRLIQMGGTSFLIGLLFGDVTGGGAAIFAARSLLDASYSRDNETEADSFSITVMQKLGRSPTAMGEFLLRITGKSKGGLTIFSSHPLSEERLERMRKEARAVTGPELLTAQEWTALKAVCEKR